jgi:hypothetical protein
MFSRPTDRRYRAVRALLALSRALTSEPMYFFFPLPTTPLRGQIVIDLLYVVHMVADSIFKRLRPV